MLKHYGCSEAYLLGGQDTKDIDNQVIYDKIAIFDEAINALEQLKKEQVGYINCNDPMLMNLSVLYEQRF